MQCLWIMVLLLSLYTVNSQINEEPLDVTAKIGGNVTLRCGVSDPARYTEWIEYATSSLGKTIFDSDNGVRDSTKYEIEGTYHLIIKNLVLQDGGFYGCKVSGMDEAARADLVVIEEPEPYSEPLYEGEMALMACTTRYKSARHDDINPDHIPKSEAYIYEDTKVTDGEIIEHPDYYETRIRINYTANVGDNGRDLTCRIYTTNPAYEDMTLLPLDVQYPVQNLQFAPRNEFYYVGEYINCTADGNPAATYEWIAISSPGPAPVYQSTLNILSTMIGSNTWKCVARNTAREPVAIEDEISFEVVPDDGGSSGESGPGTTEAWVIAVAVIIPLAVIAVVVVLIVVFWKKRMSPTPHKPKPVQNNPNFEESGSIEEQYPENHVNGKPKPSMQSKPKPMPQPVVNPGYSLNPAGQVGYGIPPQPGRSPGYADLGIKHIPAYAQPPSLNSSLEHNMGLQPNGVNGHNVNPNPYSRAPLAINTPDNPVMASMNQKRQMSLSGSLASLRSETGV